MSGVEIILSLLEADAGISTMFAGKEVQAGDFPLNTPLPAISVNQITSTDTQELAPDPTGKRFVHERVQVTVFAATYPEMKAGIKAVRKACADQLYPDIEPFTGITVHTESQGPDFSSEDGTIRIGTQDFRVHFNEDR